MRATLGIADGAPRRSRLSWRRYTVMIATGLVLTGVQLLLFPRWLAPREFGIVVLAISATQALLQFGDLGLARVCIDAGRPPEERACLRADGHALTQLSALLLVAVAFVAWGLVDRPQRAVLAAVGLAGITAALVAADKFRAAEYEVAGDEVGSAGLNLLWSNVPKLGLILGLVLFRQAVLLAVVSVATALALSRPYIGSVRRAVRVVRDVRVWMVPCLGIVSSFVLMWSDTYFLSARLGVAAAGAYEALYRILGVCTYVFLPWTSVITNRVSVGERGALVRPLILSVASTAVVLLGATLLVRGIGPSLFPRLDLPLGALPGLIAFYLLLPVSYSIGAALYVRSGAVAVAVSAGVAASVALVGHTVFTLNGGPAEAAAVAACALGVAVAMQAFSYLRASRRITARSVEPVG